MGFVLRIQDAEAIRANALAGMTKDEAVEAVPYKEYTYPKDDPKTVASIVYTAYKVVIAKGVIREPPVFDFDNETTIITVPSKCNIDNTIVRTRASAPKVDPLAM